MSDQNSAERSLADGLTELAELIARRDWEAARSLGQRLVAAHPTSASAHAALGDIAAAQQEYHVAAQWYELSLRLEPNADVQARLEQVRQAEAMGPDSEAPEPGEVGRAPRVGLIVAAIAAFLVVALLVTFITVWVVRKPRDVGQAEPRAVSRPAYRPGAGGRGGPGALPSAPSAPPRTRPTPMVGQRQDMGKAAAPEQATKADRGPTVVQRVTQSVAGPMSDSDLYLTRSLGTLTWPTTGNPLGADVQASLDPFTGYCLITVQVPKGMPKTPLYPLVMDTAYAVAVNALRTDRAVDSMTIRFLVTLVNDSGKDTVLVAFRGNTNRETVEYYLKRNVQPDRETLWRNVFATTWWNPTVPAY